MVGCAMRTKMPTGRYLHGAHGAPYFDKTLNLLALTTDGTEKNVFFVLKAKMIF